MEIRLIEPTDRPWSNALVSQHFGSSRVVSRGRLHDAATLPGFVATQGGVPVGLAICRFDGDECEVVVLIVERPREGIGTALLQTVREAARSRGCTRLWLVTTNDNLDAQSFYATVGWKLVAVHRGALAQARILKPEISRYGSNGIPIDDELEYELDPIDAPSGVTPSP